MAQTTVAACRVAAPTAEKAVGPGHGGASIAYVICSAAFGRRSRRGDFVALEQLRLPVVLGRRLGEMPPCSHCNLRRHRLLLQLPYCRLVGECGG